MYELFMLSIFFSGLVLLALLFFEYDFKSKKRGELINIPVDFYTFFDVLDFAFIAEIEEIKGEEFPIRDGNIIYINDVKCYVYGVKDRIVFMSVFKEYKNSKVDIKIRD